MSDPTRWLASDDASADLKALLQEAEPPSPLPKAVRRRVLGRISTLAPAFTIFGLSLKAAATTFAASAVVSSVTIVGVREWQHHVASTRDASNSHGTSAGDSSGRQLPHSAPHKSREVPQAPETASDPPTKSFELAPEQAPVSPTANSQTSTPPLPTQVSPVPVRPQSPRQGTSLRVIA